MRWTAVAVVLVGCSGGADGGDGSDGAGPVAGFLVGLPAGQPSTHTELADRCEVELPVTYECEGPSPEVRWQGAPEGTDGFVLIFDDPDAGDFPHWAVWGLPGSLDGLAEGVSGQARTGALPAGASEATNGFGFEGYLGSCPPAPHVYRWRVWAMPSGWSFTAPSGDAAAVFGALETAAGADALGVAETCHTYGPRSDL